MTHSISSQSRHTLLGVMSLMDILTLSIEDRLKIIFRLINMFQVKSRDLQEVNAHDTSFYSLFVSSLCRPHTHPRAFLEDVADMT